MLQIIRWLPDRKVIFVGDSSFATHELANSIRSHATLISRLRLDANLFTSPPKSQKWVGPVIPKPESFLTAPNLDKDLVSAGMTPRKGRSYLTPLFGIGAATRQHPSDGCWSVTRMAKRTHRHFSAPISIWCRPTSSQPTQGGQIEVTFQESRACHGVETQRQWSDKAIARTTPVLLGLYSLICLWAEQTLQTHRMSYAAAWYKKNDFTLSDAIAAIRCEILLSHFLTGNVIKLQTMNSGLLYTLCRIMYKVERIQSAEKTLRLDHVYQSLKAAHRTFLLDKERRVNEVVRIIHGDDQIPHLLGTHSWLDPSWCSRNTVIGHLAKVSVICTFCPHPLQSVPSNVEQCVWRHPVCWPPAPALACQRFSASK